MSGVQIFGACLVAVSLLFLAVYGLVAWSCRRERVFHIGFNDYLISVHDCEPRR